MATILLIETATDVCSVAISVHSTIVSQRTIESGMRHSAALTTMIQDLVSQLPNQFGDLKAIAMSDGPGSYTGLRVGASVAKAICYAHDLPLIAVPTLHTLAGPYINDDCPVMATIDARRMEAYATILHNDSVLEEVHSIIFNENTVAHLVATHQKLIITGTGIEKAAQLFDPFEHLIIKPGKCEAALLAPLAYKKYRRGDFVNVAYHTPFYFKSPNITKSKKKLLE